MAIDYNRIAPELCKLTKEPFDDENYIFEPKLDGIRCIAYYNNPHVTLINRAFNDITDRFPDITRHFSLPYNCILDGELVCFGRNNIPDFQRMQARMNRKQLIGEYASIYPASFVVFDVLACDGKDVTRGPLVSRKAILEVLLRDTLSVIKPIRFTPTEGIALFESLTADGWEGIVAKPIDSKYRPGQRKEWLKIKASQYIDAVILGCTRGTGRRQPTFGALALGVMTDSGMEYIGEVGTGFTDEDLTTLMQIMRQYRMPNEPADSNIKFYVEPRIQVRIKYLERTNDGILRFPVYKGVLGY